MRTAERTQKKAHTTARTAGASAQTGTRENATSGTIAASSASAARSMKARMRRLGRTREGRRGPTRRAGATSRAERFADAPGDPFVASGGA